MSDGTTSADLENMDGTPSVETAEAPFDWSQVPDELSNETTRNDAYNRYLDAAGSSGVDSPLVQTLKDAWKTGGKAIDAVGAFAKGNPALTSMLTAGVGNAQRQKYDAEQLAKMNQFKIDSEDRSTARDKVLYDRRNQSIIDTAPANMGIIGRGALDSHLAYLQGRK